MKSRNIHIIEVAIGAHMTHVGLYSIGGSEAIQSHAHFRLPKPWNVSDIDKWDVIAALFTDKGVTVHGFDVVDAMHAYVSIGEFPAALEGHKATLRGLFFDEMAREYAERQLAMDKGEEQ